MKNYNRDTEEYLKHDMPFFNCQWYGDSPDAHWKAYVSMFQPHGYVVDMGCGSGEYGARGIADSIFSNYIGVTTSDVQKSILDEKGLACIVADMCNTGLPDGFADTVMFNESIGYVDHFQALKEAARILKPGGFVCIKDFTPKDEMPLYVQKWDYSALPFSILELAAEKAGLTLLLAHRPVVDTSRWIKFMQESNMAEWYGMDTPNARSLAVVFFK